MYDSPEIIKGVGALLRQPIPKSGVADYVRQLDALRYDLAEAVVDQMRLVYEKRKQMLWPKDADTKLTELDRQTRLNADLAILERDWEFLKKLEILTAERLELIKIYFRETKSH